MNIEYNKDQDIFLITNKEKRFYYNDYSNIISSNANSVVSKVEVKKRVKKQNYIYLKVLPTNQCNLNCTYCFSQNDRSEEKLEYKTISPIIEDIKKRNEEITVAFTGGGEPTLNFPLIRELVEAFNEHPNVSFNITTNGIFNQEVLDFIVAKKFKVAMSIDGSYDTVTMEQRGGINPDKYEIAINNAVILKEKKVPITILSVTTLEALKVNPNIQEETLEHFFNKGLNSISLTFDASMFHQKLSKEELNLISKACIGVIRWKSQHKDSTIIDNMIYNANNSYNPNLMCSTLYAAGKGLTILPNGNLTFCHRIQEKEFQTNKFDFYSNSFKERLNSQMLNNIIVKVKEYKKNCSTCISRQICMSQVCPATFVNFFDYKIGMEYYCKNMINIRENVLKTLILG
jgi:radical SAM protein with 4Fe4S-binding SPASM domain